MLLLPFTELPDDPDWIRELKLDGYGALAMQTAGQVQLRSRNDNTSQSGIRPLQTACGPARRDRHRW